MKLKRICIQNLFGIYNYDFGLKIDEKITIIHAPNGMGKTTILRIVKAAITGNVFLLRELEFVLIKLTFDNDLELSIKKQDLTEDQINEIRSSEQFRRPYYIRLENLPKEVLFTYTIKSPQTKKTSTYKLQLDDDFYFTASRYAPLTDFGLYLENDMLEALNYPPLFFIRSRILVNKLLSIQKELYPHIINTNRLLTQHISLNKQDDDRFPNRYYRDRDSIKLESVDTITDFSEDMKKRIEFAKSQKESVSEVLDSTFPMRILESYNIVQNFDEEKIKEDLTKLEKKRADLITIGVIEEDDKSNISTIKTNQNFPLESLRLLNLYIDDTYKKLSQYDDLKEKIQLLLHIINDNNVLSNKTLSINSKTGVKFTSDNGTEIPITKLSSGEKHLFILFYDLIFNCSKKNMLLLIDEPEISMHIAWQEEFINDLLEICKLNDIQAIVATHSPNIINSHWDKVIDIQEND